MGRWATYIVGSERPDPPAAYYRYGGTAVGWSWWELPISRGDPWDPGPGFALVAHIYDSDAAVVNGLHDGERQWQWTFGEGAAAFYQGVEVDDEELEETLPARAAEAAGLIAAWAERAALPGVDKTAVAELLQDGYVFAEEGFAKLLEALEIVVDDSSVESEELVPDEEPAPDDTGHQPPAGPDMVGLLAAAIDHSSAGWRDLVGTRWLQTFGEPPAMVAFDGSVFIAFDPPISLGSYGRESQRDWVSLVLGVSGGWQEVPSEPAGGLLEAAAWARENIGVQGRPADENRLPLNVELPLEYPDGVEAPGRYPDISKNEWWRYSVADPSHAGVELAMGTELLDRTEPVADWLDHARSLLLTPLAENYAEAGAPVHAGERDVPPYALVLTTVYKTARGRYGSTGGDDKGWRRVLKRLRLGELTAVTVGAAVADSRGNLRDVQPWGGLSIGAKLAASREFDSLPAHLTVEISDQLRRLSPSPFVEDLISRAAATLPVVGGWVDVGRALLLGGGWSRYEQFAAVRSDVRRDPRSCVRGPAWRILLGPEHLRLVGGREALEATELFTSFREIDTPDGPLLMVQCGEQPVNCTAEHRAEMVRVLAPLLPEWPDR
ncbi:hypothetical protein [Pseudonocardia sp.]|uniref:hypothetical protein n=1 Tax=Pseudonocardia sp. TaxID=60912 RepID=UPI0031FDD0F0